MNGEQAFLDALLDPGRAVPRDVTVWSGSDATSRFGVYRNNVLASLIDALADTYPVAQELAGDDFFRAMARLFVNTEPPRSRVLVFYGASFPDFIEHFPPAASVPYLADVARLEMLRVRACHSLDCNALSAAAIALLLTDVDRLPDLVLKLHPSPGILRSQYAAASLWAAHQGSVDMATIDPDVPESMLIIWPHLEVEVMPVTARNADFIEHLSDGPNLGTSVERASLADADFDLGDALRLLVQAQAITSVETAGAQKS